MLLQSRMNFIQAMHFSREMYDADYCEVQSFSRRIRFAREFGNNLYTVIPGDKFKTYYLATMEELQQIKLR